MKENLKNSCIVTIMAVLTSALTFGVLDRDLFGEDPPDPEVEAWFQDCVARPPCVQGCPGGMDGVGCNYCEFALPRRHCVFAWLSTCNSNTPPPGEQDCGRRWNGFCLGTECLHDIVNEDGICARSWCS